jgi:hypothetical protein
MLLTLQSVVSKYVYKHVIKTNYESTSDLYDKMISDQYFDLYLQEIGATNIDNEKTFIPKIISKYVKKSKTITYTCLPNIKYIPFKIPLKIVQKWIFYNSVLDGNLYCKYMDFNLKIELMKNETVYLNITGEINDKSFIVPNNALNDAIMEYEQVFRKIISKF